MRSGFKRPSAGLYSLSPADEVVVRWNAELLEAGGAWINRSCPHVYHKAMRKTARHPFHHPCRPKVGLLTRTSTATSSTFAQYAN
jgi:hypothetical protein